ncbi:MAG: hypothetical protein ABR991_12930, partial [Terracidiphilus sp.]
MKSEIIGRWPGHKITKNRCAPFIHIFIVKFHEILYTLLSGHPLQVGVQRSTVHCSGPLSAEVDFANQ